MLLSLILMAYWSSMISGPFAKCALITRQTGLSRSNYSGDGVFSANVQMRTRTTDEDNENTAAATSYPYKPSTSPVAIKTNDSILVNHWNSMFVILSDSDLNIVHGPINGPKLPPRDVPAASIPTLLVTPRNVSPAVHKTRPLSNTSPTPCFQPPCERSLGTTSCQSESSVDAPSLAEF